VRVCVCVCSCAAFDNSVVGVHAPGTTHQVHDNAEDSFIDEMAMGHLLCKDPRGTLLAGTVEGLVAEMLQVCVRPYAGRRPTDSLDPRPDTPFEWRVHAWRVFG